MKNRFSLAFTLFCIVLLMTACSSNGASSSSNNKEFTPTKEVEFVVPYSAGGGSDMYARVFAQVSKESKLVDQNIVVINKEGGSGAVGNTYTFNKKGDSETLMTWAPGQQAGTVLNNADVKLENLTPIATLAEDSFLVVVKKDSKFNSLEDLINAAKEAPNKITVGGSGVGNEDHLLYHLINKNYKTKLKYVTFNSGGETTSALLGGHIDVVISNPNEILPQIEAGEVKALATSAEERLEGPLDQVPTFKELGHPEIKVAMFRGVVGPPDMPKEAVKYWENVMKEVSESEEWQEGYIKKYSLQNVFKGAEESKKYYEDVLEEYLEIHKELGTYK
jgi:putative tricarboxylic transport membrane protein